MGDLEDLAAAAQAKSGKHPARPAPPADYLDRVWTIHDQGRQFGPHTEHELAMFVGSGSVSREALVWREGSPRWIPITNLVPGVSSPIHAHPPTNAGHVTVNISNVNAIGVARGNGFGTASLVLGIIAVVFVCLPFASIPLATIGLILGIVGATVGGAKGLPTGSSIAGCVLCGLIIAVAIVIAAGIVGAISSMPKMTPAPNFTPAPSPVN